VNIKIPPGVSSGNYMTVDGMGNEAPQNGQPGDLIAVFDEKPHDFFGRQGDNIICDMPISFTTAALGGTIVVPTIDGEEKLIVPSGTQPGKVLRLKGKGIPHLHQSGRGDELVRLHVWVPTRLSAEEERTLRSLDRSESFRAPQASKSFLDKLRETLGV
jgi:molecular chaperone DnaJ